MTSREAWEVLSHYTIVDHGVLIKGDITKIKEALLITEDALQEIDKLGGDLVSAVDLIKKLQKRGRDNDIK